MIIHHPTRTNLNIPQIKMMETQVQCVDSFDFLGITIDQHLNWKAHVDKISSTISRSLGILNKLKYFLPLSAKIKIYNSIILSHMNYGICTWGHRNIPTLKIQKKAIRTVTCAKYNAHTDPLFKEHNLLKIDDIFTLSKYKFYYKYLHKKLPVNLQELPFLLNEDQHRYDTRQNFRLFINRYNHSFAKNCLRFDLPQTINSAPPQIKEKFYSHSYQGFVKYVKHHMLNNYQEICDIQNCYVCSNHRNTQP